MRSLLKVVIIACMVVAQPLSAQGISGQPRHIEILVDPIAHRAYVPIGTVIPAGLQLRVWTHSGPERAQGSWNREKRPWNPEKLGTPQTSHAMQPPLLVFEYAPESRFEEARSHHPSLAAARSAHFKPAPLYDWGPYYYDITIGVQGVDGLYYMYFQAGISGTLSNTGPNTESYSAHTYPEDDASAGVASIFSNHFSCYDSNNGDYGEAYCETSYTTTPANTDVCGVDLVAVYGTATHIEYLQDHVPNYLTAQFQIGFCSSMVP